jgi:hypothetical protein
MAPVISLLSILTSEQVFSLGPDFSEQWLEEKLGFENRYPVPKELWYTSEQRRGFVVRMRLRNGTQIGSFEGDP